MFTAPVLGLIVKLATVLGSCCPEVADPARIEKLEFVVLAAVSTVFDPQFVHVPVRFVMTPEVGVAKALPVATDIALLNTIGFEVVPATAGQVRVAVPEVEPAPVRTQDVVPAMPHCMAVENRFDQ